MTAPRCPVCGYAVVEAATACERCFVLYHPRCWSYLGRCAIYGCRPDAPPPRRRVAEALGEGEPPHWGVPRFALAMFAVAAAIAAFVLATG